MAWSPVRPRAICNQNPAPSSKPREKHETEQLHTVRAAPLTKASIRHFAFAMRPEHFSHDLLCDITDLLGADKSFSF